MAKKSVLVYELLRSERSEHGFSPKEILHRVSQTHGLTPGKGLKRQINAALRRGVDFGILTKERHRYKFDLSDNKPAVSMAPRQTTKNNPRAGRKKRTTRKPKAPANRKTRKRTRASAKKPKELPPRPRVPPPPDWKQKPRNLREEPPPKFTKHDNY